MATNEQLEAQIVELCNELSAHVDVDTNTVIQDAVNVLRHYRKNEKRIAELEAEVAELKADKARLDCMEKNRGIHIAFYAGEWRVKSKDWTYGTGQTLRGAIDAVLAFVTVAAKDGPKSMPTSDHATEHKLR